MDGRSSEGSEARFAAYVEALGAVLGHVDRQQPMHDYCLGLLMPIERKSVEPMAAVTAPAQVAAKHQSLLHFVGNAPWSDAAMLAKVGELVRPAIQRSGPIEAWIIDDTGFPKKGRHSVGVTRQYCGQLGKQDNCQVAVTLSLANHEASLPVAYRLYLPEDWATDQARRHRAKIPETIAFQTKPEIALEQIKAARAAGLPAGVILMDAGYGNDTRLRTEITALGISYVAGIGPNTSVLASGRRPLAAADPIGTWTTPDAASTRRGAPARHRQSARLEPAGRGVANDYLARGQRGLALLALCPAARAAGAS
jgi:SRSO17 transposase